DHAVEKATSMRVFNKVVRKLTKRGSMESVGNNALTASVNSLFAALGTRLVGMKMAQILPIIGIIVGMALNVSLIRTIGVTADNLYRERLLLERYGQEESDAETEAPSDGTDDLDEELARYVELAEAESRL
ncbi:MAG: EcsC family protein, partial [Actinomyces sp.]|nr:EcsC family protein [Actinomyces sp.]